MNLSNFYSIPLEEAIDVLGEKLHYHTPNKNNVGPAMFEDFIRDCYSYIPDNSTVLDCGSGWGGPARQLIREKKCIVEGVTISKEQADYTNQFFPTHCSNLVDFIPNKIYDIAIFVQSYFHLSYDDTIKTLNNLKDYAKNILICDFIFLGNISDSVIMTNWNGFIRSKNQYYKEFSNSNFQINSLIIKETNADDSLAFWLENLNKRENLSHQWKLLKNTAELYFQRKENNIPQHLSSVTLFAKNISNLT